MALGILMIMFVAMSVISVVGLSLMYLVKGNDRRGDERRQPSDQLHGGETDHLGHRFSERGRDSGLYPGNGRKKPQSRIPSGYGVCGGRNPQTVFILTFLLRESRGAAAADQKLCGSRSGPPWREIRGAAAAAQGLCRRPALLLGRIRMQIILHGWVADCVRPLPLLRALHLMYF